MKIAVVGSMNIDKVAKVDHIPLKGETLLATDYMETFGGKGANQAVALARLGADVTMFGCVGKDGDGLKTIQHMISEGVQMAHVKQVDQVPTGCAFINVGEGDNAIVVVPGANKEVTVDYIRQMATVLQGMDILLFQNEIPMRTVTYLLATYGDQGQVLIYNPAPYRPLKAEDIQKASYITPNASEAKALFEVIEPAVIGEKCIITKGRHGVDCLFEGKKMTIPAIKCKPVDTTGAGDTFNGALAYGLGQGMVLPQAIAFANTAAGISTEQAGAQGGMPTLEDVLAAM